MHFWGQAPVCRGYTHPAHHAKAMSSVLSLCIYFTLKIHCLNLAWLCMPLIPKQADLLSSSQSGLPVRPYFQIRVKTIKSDVHLALQMDSSQMYNAGKSRFIVIGKWILFLMPKSTIGQSQRFLRCSEAHRRWHKLSQILSFYLFTFSLCGPGWPQTHGSPVSASWSGGIRGMSQLAQLSIWIFNWKLEFLSLATNMW